MATYLQSLQDSTHSEFQTLSVFADRKREFHKHLLVHFRLLEFGVCSFLFFSEKLKPELLIN